MIQAIELAGGNPIVRVPWNEPGIIGKVLDAGAHGVIVPMVNTRSRPRPWCTPSRYAPEGARSWGPVMAGMRHDDNRAWAATAHRRDPDDRDRSKRLATSTRSCRCPASTRSTSVLPTCR